jgi:hypothetical protein
VHLRNAVYFYFLAAGIQGAPEVSCRMK